MSLVIESEYNDIFFIIDAISLVTPILLLVYSPLEDSNRYKQGGL